MTYDMLAIKALIYAEQEHCDTMSIIIWMNSGELNWAQEFRAQNTDAF